MEVVIKKTREEASALGAAIMAGIIREQARPVLGLATGSTPLSLYQELVKMHREKNLSFSGVTTFNLDEYVGLPPTDPCSFASEMRQNLFDHIDIPANAVNLPDGMAADMEKSCQDYEKAITASGGIDIQLLGIGSDGHLAFNEPTSSLSSRTRLKTLSHETIEANSRFFGSPERVPRHVITMGLGTIMEAKCCLLLAFGNKKARAVAEMIEGPVSALWPATCLQYHRKVIVILDEEAAEKLQRKAYYRDVYDGKPDWQRWE